MINKDDAIMTPTDHKPIENRKLLLLCNPGQEDNDNYAPSVLSVLKRYKEFFMSPIGGAWIDKTDYSEGEIIEIDANYDDEGEQTWLFTTIADICRHADYSIIVFVGHGNAISGIDRMQLSRGKIIPISCFLAPEPFGMNTKRTVIIDACRTIAGAEQQQLILESRSFCADGMLEANLCRDMYNRQIQECEPHIELIQSTRYGDSAFVNPEGTGTAFSDAVFRILDADVPQWNEKALGIRNGQLSVSMRSLLPKIQAEMNAYLQVPDYRRFGEGEGDFPFYSLWRPVNR